MPRTVFIGDVHGCLDELRDLVEGKIRPRGQDRVILLGDLINRGPHSAGVVGYAMRYRLEAILGNHEDGYLRKQASKLPKDAWARALRREIGKAAHAWIEGLPSSIETEKFVAVHAGLLPGKTAAQTLAAPEGLKAITTLRYADAKGNWSWDEEKGLRPWWEFYRGEKPVFYGHWAKQGLALDRRNTFGLDSGCVFGERLSAYVLETGELLQVKARKRHAVKAG